MRLSGRDYYLGTHNSPESHRKYAALIAEWSAGGGVLSHVPDTTITVAELIVRFLDHAESYYVERPRGSCEYMNFKDATAPLYTLYARLPIDAFGPKKLRAVRELMIERRLARTTINSRTRRLRQVFKWAVGEELVAPSVLEALRAVEPLRAGRTRATEPTPVTPVSEAHIRKALRYLTPPVAAMVRVQKFTGMRPGEVVIMRGTDLEMRRDAWLYRPTQHKTAHFGRKRVVPIGPKAQAVIRTRLTTDLSGFLFASRRGTPYAVCDYARAVRRGCERAGVEPHWTPNQLRHTAATNYRRKFGLEPTQALLGHADARTTERYADVNLDAAIAAVRKIG